MKKLLFFPALVLMAMPASAGQLMPYLYANEYCELRDLGVSANEARDAAVAASYVSGLPDMPTVTVGGTKTKADVVKAVRAVHSQCPQHL